MNTVRAPRTNSAQRGTAGVMFVIAIPVLLGFVGLAIDMASIYSRRIELQQIADSVALAAASELDGTKDGAKNAKTAARDVATQSVYSGHITFTWDGSALSFATSADAPDWMASNSVNNDTNAANRVFARVDVNKLYDPIADVDLSAIQMIFATVLPNVADTINYANYAVAGKIAAPITPLALCAMSTTASATHPNAGGIAADTVAYGFRTGVSYNLLQLGPSNNGNRQAFLVNPVDPTDRASNPAHFSPTYMRPFICAGSAELGHVGAGSSVYVQALADTFIADGLNLTDWLNSRFGASTTCNAQTAPPDFNVREFNGNPGDYSDWYMQTQQYTVAASDSAQRKSPKSLIAFADLSYQDVPSAFNTPASPSEVSFGPLWAYKQPSKPSGTFFAGSDWPNMYQFRNAPSGTGTIIASVRAALGYPASKSPYLLHVKPPASGIGVKNRRVLNIPLLDCTGGSPASKAAVLAIGQFFMTAKATDTVIPGEFAGTLRGTTALSSAVLYK
jgi:Flp pilus assembly protein TadG